jgi:hypothetical protein
VAVLADAEHHAQKKRLHAAEQDRADVVAARHAFIRRQPALDPSRLVFIDETPAFARAGSGPPPTWRAGMAGPPAVCDCWRRYRMGIGR